MGAPPVSTYTYDDYLALESELADVKYEYHDGFIVAMAGGTLEHGLIAGNFIGSTKRVISDRNISCAVFTSDVKVHISASNRTFYPDASVACSDFKRSEKDERALINPILILEVLFESTASFDRGAKFTHYRQIPSLKEYVLISQDQPVVDTYYRTDNNLWEIRTIEGLDQQVLLKSIDGEIAQHDIYYMVPKCS